MLKQAALLLKYARQDARAPITKFIVIFTGLDELHFRQIKTDVQRMPALMDPTGRPVTGYGPNVNARNLDSEMLL